MPPWWVSTRAAALRFGFTTCGWSGATSASIRAGSPGPAGSRCSISTSITVERLRIDEADLLAFVRAQRGLRHASLTLGEGEARVTAGLGGGPEVAGRIRLFPGFGGAPFALEIDEVRLGGIPLPDLLAGWIVRHFDPTAQLSRLPMAVAFGPVRIVPGRLEITGPPTGGSTR